MNSFSKILIFRMLRFFLVREDLGVWAKLRKGRGGCSIPTRYICNSPIGGSSPILQQRIAQFLFICKCPSSIKNASVWNSFQGFGQPSSGAWPILLGILWIRWTLSRSLAYFVHRLGLSVSLLAKLPTTDITPQWKNQNNSMLHATTSNFHMHVGVGYMNYVSTFWSNLSQILRRMDTPIRPKFSSQIQCGCYSLMFFISLMFPRNIPFVNKTTKF